MIGIGADAVAGEAVRKVGAAVIMNYRSNFVVKDRSQASPKKYNFSTKPQLITSLRT